jgi:GH15 family glucan-1,4-alpha-glucosidase
MSYQPIEDYGMIGNMHTAALVGKNGSIDWCCLPHFDSPSVFGAILDDKKGGFFSIAPVNEAVSRRQVYWPETNVLVTRFLLPGGVIEVVDYMPVGLKKGERGYRHLIRRVEAIRGCVPVRLRCCPAFNYARDQHSVSATDRGVMFESPSLSIELLSRVPLEIESEHGGVQATFSLPQGQRAAVCRWTLRNSNKACSSKPSTTGTAGSANAPTAAGGARWSIARHWLSNC